MRKENVEACRILYMIMNYSPVNRNSSSLLIGLGGASSSAQLPSSGSRDSGDGMYVVGLYSCALGFALLFARRTGSSSARRRSRATSRTRRSEESAVVLLSVFVERFAVMVERSVATSVRRVATSPWTAWTSSRSVATSKRRALTLVSRCWSLVRRFVTQAGSAAARAAGMYAWSSKVSEVIVGDCWRSVLCLIRQGPL
jgi:hypothetical protein